MDTFCEHTVGTNVIQQQQYDDDLIVNCRNIWFREFWSQHNKCEFDKTTTGGKVDARTANLCSGKETIQFEQEGLVPFVGKYFLVKKHFFMILFVCLVFLYTIITFPFIFLCTYVCMIQTFCNFIYCKSLNLFEYYQHINLDFMIAFILHLT